MVEACSGLLVDYLSVLFDPADLPSLAPDWDALEASRMLAYERPWSHAILRVLELDAYQAHEHPDEWIAHRLGIEPQEVADCLALLERARLVKHRKGRWVLEQVRMVDTGPDRQAAMRLKQWSLQLAAERLASNGMGAFGQNLFSVSRVDMKRLEEMQATLFREMRRLIASSQPSECVGLFNYQLLRLDRPAENK